MEKTLDTKEVIKSLVSTFAEEFSARHEREVDNSNGTLNMKIHNVFISELGSDIQYYSALVRSLESSLGNMLEKLAIEIAKFFYEVKKNVEGPLSKEQTQQIAELLERYKRRDLTVSIQDYQFLREKLVDENISTKRHDSDYYLIDKETGENFLIELKIGGDLDNKKSRAEKEALLEQFAILSNTLNKEEKIKIFFATAYNRYGEDREWKQERVMQYFAREELLIGKDFWNFICKSDDGYDLVLNTYKKNANIITKALEDIKKTYFEE